MTHEHFALRHRGGGEEEKKRKKRKSSRVVACGDLFGMRFVDFIYLLIFFPEFVYGQQGCHMWGSIWDEICLIFLFIIIFSWICVSVVACVTLFGVKFVRFYLFFIIIFSEFVCGLSPGCELILSLFYFFKLFLSY